VKVDFKKELKELYNPKPGVFSLVKVPKLQYLMVDGQGDPNKVVEYQEAKEPDAPLLEIWYSPASTSLMASKPKEV
jgi:hypothetical protein